MSGLGGSVLAVLQVDLGPILYPQVPQFFVALNLQSSIFENDHCLSALELGGIFLKVNIIRLYLAGPDHNHWGLGF